MPFKRILHDAQKISQPFLTWLYIKTELPGVELAKMSIREHKRLKVATILHKNIKIAQTSQEETNRAHSY